MESCQETSGFLFSHRCGRPGVLSCQQCHKRICPLHARAQPPEAFLCVSCAAQGQVVAGTGTDWDSDDDDDPHFYSRRHRRKKDKDNDDESMDFTEGDQGKLADQDDPFEGDMGGS